MSVSVTQSASLSISGVTPSAGTGFTLLANPSLSAVNVAEGDYFANVFTVNANTTPPVATDMGAIATGSVLWIQTDRPINVSLVQTTGTNTFTVDSFLYLNAAFTGLAIENTDPTNNANINYVIAGDRATNPGTPGIY